LVIFYLGGSGGGVFRVLLSREEKRREGKRREMKRREAKRREEK
jgi:hypothetical protein